MASKKKTSVYSDRGAVGPAEELDTYGVWVKSEPQDITAGFETANFDTEAVPYEADFDTDFGDLGLSDSDFADLGEDFPPLGGDDDDSGFASDDFSTDSFATGSFDDNIAAVGRGTEEASTEFLMKIAGELSSIRSELNTLKREFADIRAESGKLEPADDFFAPGEETEEDEKIALTGDEMENFLASADFSGGEDPSLDPQREADEAALRELSEQNEASAETTAEAEQEDIEIDFDNLGINFDDGLEVESEPEPELQAAEPEDFLSLEEETAPAEAAPQKADVEEAALHEADAPIDDDFGALSFDSLSFDSDDLGVAALETEPQEELQAAAEEDFADELVPVAPEEDEELQNLRREGATPHTPAPDNTHYLENDPFVLETSDLEEISEENVTEEAAPEETATEEIATEEVSDEISTDEIATEEVSTEETAAETAVAEDASSVEDVASSEGASSVEDVVTEADSSFDDINFDLNIDDTDNFAEIAPLEEEAPVEEPAVEEVAVKEEAVEEEAAEAEIPPLEEEPVAEEAIAEEPVAETTETALQEAVEEAAVEETAADPLAEDFDIVSDEPDFSAGIVDTPVEEPSPDDLSFGDLSFDDDASFDDVSFDMDDFGEIEEAKPDEPVAAKADDAVEPAADLAEDTEIAAAGTADDSLALDDAEASPDADIGLDSAAEATDLSVDDFDMGDLGDDLVFDDDKPVDDKSAVADAKPQAKAESKPVSRDNSAVSMDQVIPEGFEINAQEAAISSDDLEAALPEEELSIAGADAASSEAPAAAAAPASAGGDGISAGLKTELVSVLSYLDNLLASLPEDKMKEFAKSEYFDSYQKIFKELGLV